MPCRGAVRSGSFHPGSRKLCLTAIRSVANICRMKALTRRQFLHRASLAGSAPLVLPAAVLGRDGVAPSGQIRMACVGVGGMGTGNLRSFLQDERVRVVAICDVDANHRRRALEIAGLKAGDGFGNFQDVMAREDIDAVMIATPDHWHSIITLAAVAAGKDVYCEKPLAASIGEGRRVSDSVRKNRRVLQCGTWRRSSIHTRKACELVRNGYIGTLQSIEVGVPGTFAIRGGYTGLEAPQPVPPELDYSMWLGPAPRAPYTAARCHFNFRWVLDYAPGYITDWGAHFLDVAQWGNGTDHTAPVQVSARNVTRRDRGIYDAPESFEIDYQYANGVKMTMFSTTDTDKWGIKFVGSEGWIFTENERLETYPDGLLRLRLNDAPVKLHASNHHHRDFIDAVLNRSTTAAPVETAHRAASCCHIGAISARLGRPLNFDPRSESFVDDDDANELRINRMHGGWTLPVG